MAEHRIVAVFRLAIIPSALRRVGDDPVAATALGRVKRIIRPLEKRVGRVVGALQGAEADAGRHSDRVAQAGTAGRLMARCSCERFGGYTRAKAFADLIGARDFGIRHDDHELFAAEPAGEIHAACIALQPHREFAQDRVPGIVTVGVVDDLEMIDVSHQHR